MVSSHCASLGKLYSSLWDIPPSSGWPDGLPHEDPDIKTGYCFTNLAKKEIVHGIKEMLSTLFSH